MLALRGTFAYTAQSIVPINAPIQVPINTPLETFAAISALPTMADGSAKICGFRMRM